MNFLSRVLSYYHPLAPRILVYMLQQVEYRPAKFADWVDGIPNLGQAQKRQRLDLTMRARVMLIVAYTGWLFPLGLGLGFYWKSNNAVVLPIFFAGPLFCIVNLFFVSLALQHLVVIPTQNREVATAGKKLAKNPAVRIAILGSYGKTTMKELLATILSEGKVVMSTPGNKNVLISHARWVNKVLNGQEEILIFEYGEAGPGDIARLAGFSRPNWAIVTGLAPAHLDDYGSLDAIARDFADINNFVPLDKLYLNGESEELKARLKNGNQYDQKGVNGWRVSDIKLTIAGTDFTLKKHGKILRLHTGLLGAHQIGPLVTAVDIAATLGLTDDQIIAGVAKTMPFEHRMQPYKIGSAWVIDDTYNGNIEGVRAGLALLEALKITGQKIYVTPGLVEQGELTEVVHKQMGQLIAKAHPDRVILMKNSVTPFIQAGLDEGGFAGELLIEPVPLDFYNNLEHFIAAGDLVLMQNDWPDSYR